MVTEKLKKICESVYLIPIIYLFCFLCQVFDLTLLCICVLASVVSVILFFAEDFKNIFGIVFYVGFYVKNILKSANWLLYGICIGVAVAGFIYFTVYWGIKKRNTLKKGALFYPLIVADVAFLTAGMLYDFTVVKFLITLGCCFVCLLMYFNALNFTNNLKDYLTTVFIFGGIFVLIETFWTNGVNGGTFADILHKSDSWIGSENQNTAALYFSLAIISCFYKGFKTVNDGRYFCLASLFYGAIIMTQCRAMMIFGIVAYIVLSVYTFVKSENRRNYLIYILSLVAVVMVFVVIFRENVAEITRGIMDKNARGLSGREQLWAQCIRIFTENPVFGAGYIAKENMASISVGAEKFIHAHNTVIQWLTSLGIFGSVLLIWFYVKKYCLVFRKFTGEKFFLSCLVLIIEASGMLDQVATCHLIVFMIPLILLAEIEKTDLKPLKS